MWYADRASDQVGYGKHFKYFLSSGIQFIAFAQMILDTIIAAQDHRSNEAE